MRRVRSQAERFWPKVNKNGPIPEHQPALGPCWVWLGGKALDGYGRFRLGRAVDGMAQAHRWSLEQSLGRAVPAEMHACHRCDNPACVNPAHLFEGTQIENELDKLRKGRTPRGDRHGRHTEPHRTARGSRGGRAKLTEADIPVIRSRVANGETQNTVAQSFNVTPTIISRILKRKIWRHVQ